MAADFTSLKYNFIRLLDKASAAVSCRLPYSSFCPDPLILRPTSSISIEEAPRVDY